MAANDEITAEDRKEVSLEILELQQVVRKKDEQIENYLIEMRQMDMQMKEMDRGICMHGVSLYRRNAVLSSSWS